MSRKRRSHAHTPSDKPTSKRAHSKAAAQNPSLWWRSPRGVVGIVALAVIGIVAVVFGVRASQPVNPASYQQGTVSNCNTVQPEFARALGFSRNAAFDTRSNYVHGIALYDLDAQGNILRSYQHPSWIGGGYLSHPVLDAAGNIYVAPIPAVSVLSNPIEQANTVYRIDAQTGVMSPYIDLPAGAPANEENPYGLLALGYDCETNSLYASSVYGSNRTTQAGRIYHINLTTGAVQSQMNEVDAFGLGVFNTAHGKRLYFGQARQPRILSVRLDSQGNLSGDLREEFVLDEFEANTDQRACVMRFIGMDRLQLRTIQFSFNLVAPTEVRGSTLEYVYDAQTDSWR